MANPTSVESYRQVISSGRENTQLSEVFRIVDEHGPVSRRDIAKLTGFELSAVCGRVNKLVRQQVIKERGTKVCERTGKHVAVLVVRSPDVGFQKPSDARQGDLFPCQ